jgi:hypothetical protein
VQCFQTNHHWYYNETKKTKRKINVENSSPSCILHDCSSNSRTRDSSQRPSNLDRAHVNGSLVKRDDIREDKDQRHDAAAADALDASSREEDNEIVCHAA